MSGPKTCEVRMIPEQGEFPMVWEFTEHAHYHEFHDPRTNKTFDAWEVRVSTLICVIPNNAIQ